jgi:hypothetical protein
MARHACWEKLNSLCLYCLPCSLVLKIAKSSGILRETFNETTSASQCSQGRKARTRMRPTNVNVGDVQSVTFLKVD